MKEALRQLHAVLPPDQVKEGFRHVLEDTSSIEIAKNRRRTHQGRRKAYEMRKLCDVHLAIFKEQIERQKPDSTPTQPINILMEEHKIMLQRAEQLLSITHKMPSYMRYVTDEIHRLRVVEYFADSEKHYLREENVLFPSLKNIA
ncbi:MAG: DUF438 domain-containing protein [Candidatus Bathyarchaeota archaeon]|nr:DUF438 domain-containing protein [Candidatus Bathyarchaeota archaeon]